MKEKIVLIGGGGHCHSVIDVIEQENKYEIIGIVDIKENIGKVDYIFVSTHKEVRDALIKNNLYFTLVYPFQDCFKVFLTNSGAFEILTTLLIRNTIIFAEIIFGIG